MTRVVEGRLVTPQGLVTGALRFGERIVEIIPASSPYASAGEERYVLSGFIDVHVHGGGGGDTMDGPQGVRTLARFHLGHGTTTLYPTTITHPWEAILRALESVRQVMADGDPQLPDLPGVHLEGPFISSRRLGAQPPCPQSPTPEKIGQLLELGTVRLVTMAPEIAGGLEAAARLARAGVRVSVGHSAATFEQAQALLAVVKAEEGVVGFTHLYNAMGGLAGREPGVVGAALADGDSFAELILDGHHVHRGSFLAAFRAKPGHVLLVTDAIRACGLPEGTTELGGQRVTVAAGAARLEDGTLAGSVLTLDQALRNAVAAGLSLQEASTLLSFVPANYLGLTDRGALEVGRRADLVVLGADLRAREVYVAGRRVVG